MLVEKLDFLELLRVSIAHGAANNGKMPKDVILGELALLDSTAQMWAELLVEKVDFERIALITEAKKVYETNIVNGVEVKKRIDDIPGKVEFAKGGVNSANFFKIRNKLAVKIHKVMIQDNFKPNNVQGDLSNVAKGLAEVVLRNRLFVKAMCAKCQGLGRLEKFNGDMHAGEERCTKCDGYGKRPYTLNEKINIAKLKVSKSGYVERYFKYEELGEGVVMGWEDKIRSRIAKSFHFKEEELALS